MKKRKLLLSLFLISFALLNAQNEKKELQKKIKRISEAACECIAKINTNLAVTERNEEIESCITGEIIHDQTTDLLRNDLEKVKDTVSKLGSTKDTVTINSLGSKVIIADKNYSEIEAYLLKNCKAMKEVISVSDEMHENSLSDKEKALEYYNEGVDHYRNGAYENAVVAYKKAVKKDRKFAFAWDNLGLSYRRLGNYKQAIKAYKKSLRLDPKGRVPLMNLPIAYLLLKDYEAAIEGYQKFQEIYPEDPEGYYGVSRVYLQTEDYEKALDNVMRSYVIYKKLNSPYHKDAQQIIITLYTKMKEKDMMDTFREVAKKHNITFEE